MNTRPHLAALLSGILYVFSFAPWDLGFLQWVAWIPVFLTSLEPSKDDKTALFQGLIMSAVITIGGFYWVTHAAHQYGNLPYWSSVILLGVFAIINQIHLPVFLVLRSRLSRSPLAILVSALVYVGLESINPKLFYDTAGNAFSSDLWARQLTDLAGPMLLTFFVILINEVLAFSLLNFRRQGIFLKSIGFALFLFVGVYGYGWFRINQVDDAINAAANQKKIRVAMIQANIGDFLKVASERGAWSAVRQVIDRYLELSEQAARSGADLIVWPETAYPGIFGQPRNQIDIEAESRIQAFMDRFSGTLAIGGYDRKQGLDFNSLFFKSSGTESDRRSVYHKSILLTFGETLPGVQWFPQMKDWFENMGFFGQGQGPTVLSVPETVNHPEFLVGPSICYEALISDFSKKSSEMGSDFLLNVTNDSWFGDQGEPFLHLALASYRSIETRQYLLRSTNTGFSAVIDPAGRIISTTKLSTSEILEFSVPKRLPLDRFPSWFEPILLWTCRLFLLFVLLVKVFPRNRFFGYRTSHFKLF